MTPVNDAPKIDPIGNRTVHEGDTVVVDVQATDIDADALAYSLDQAPSGATIDPQTGRFEWVAADGPLSELVRVRVTDNGDPNRSTTAAFVIDVLNVSPQLSISGAGFGQANQPFVLDLLASDIGNDRLDQWRINWGDGAVTDIDGSDTDASHVFTQPGRFNVRAPGFDEDGQYAANTISLLVTGDRLSVVSLAPQADGFHVRFNRGFDPAVLNLYDAESVAMGAADVTLRGDATADVRGSVVFDADGMGPRFLKTGGVLRADHYTVRLSSRADGFKDLAGGLLDGNVDGTAGDDYVSDFTVDAIASPVLGIGDFARGPGQPVNVPAFRGGFPILFSGGTINESIQFTLAFDPALMVIANDPGSVILGVGLPGGSAVSFDLEEGRIHITVKPGAPVAAVSPIELVRILASVPARAPYYTKQVLNLTNETIDDEEVPARLDDGVHVVANLGDTSGNGAYSTLDIQRLQRVLGRLDSGFAAYPNADPVVIGDISGNGVLSALDATRLTQEVNFLHGVALTDRPEIPPASTGPIVFGGPDPQVAFGTVTNARAGEVVTVPVTLAGAAGLGAAELASSTMRHGST